MYKIGLKSSDWIGFNKSKSNVIIYFQSIRRAVEKRNEMRILQLTHAKKGLVPQQDQNISGKVNIEKSCGGRFLWNRN